MPPSRSVRMTWPRFSISSAGQAAGRLVEQDEARPHRQAAGDLEEALLGMREQVGAPPQDMAEADAVQQLDRARRAARGPRAPTQGRPNAVARKPARASGQPPSMALSSTGSVGSRRGFWKVRAMPRRERCWHRGGRQVFAVEADPAAVRLVVAGEEVEQRRLAAAVRADQAVHFAGAQLQRDASSAWMPPKCLPMSFASSVAAACRVETATGGANAEPTGSAPCRSWRGLDGTGKARQVGLDRLVADDPRPHALDHHLDHAADALRGPASTTTSSSSP